MTIRVIADGADGYRLLSPANDVLGWSRGRAIGVSRLPSEAAVVAAAIRSYSMVRRWLERQQLHPFPALGEEAAGIVHDGAHRWIVVGGIPVARFATTALPADGHAFEIVLKGPVNDGVAIHAALVAVQAAHGESASAEISWAARIGALGDSDALAPVTLVNLEGG